MFEFLLRGGIFELTSVCPMFEPTEHNSSAGWVPYRISTHFGLSPRLDTDAHIFYGSIIGFNCTILSIVADGGECAVVYMKVYVCTVSRKKISYFSKVYMKSINNI
jgi:hypothetical protein